MIKAAIVGLGWWGKALVESVEGSEDIQITAGATRTQSDEVREFAALHGFDLRPDHGTLLADPELDAVILSTPHSMHVDQIIAAARAGKHIFCEKPLALTRAEAERAVAAVEKAGVTLALGFNRRFHPEMTGLHQRLAADGLGTALHFEGIMTLPNGLFLPKEHWRSDGAETPCGGLTPLGVHIIDAVIDLFGEVDWVFCQSFRRVVETTSDDTTSILFRLKNGMSGYLSTIMATGPSFRFQIYGSKGWVQLNGVPHVAGASSEERRSRLFGDCVFQPLQGAAESWRAEAYDMSRASLEAFAKAAQGGPAYPVPINEVLHGVSVTEAIIKSAGSESKETVAGAAP